MGVVVDCEGMAGVMNTGVTVDMADDLDGDREMDGGSNSGAAAAHMDDLLDGGPSLIAVGAPTDRHGIVYVRSLNLRSDDVAFGVAVEAGGCREAQEIDCNVVQAIGRMDADEDSGSVAAVK